ncbi:Alpha-(1,3)-fucosyltransferase 5 [Holothuria leucospilota]|uniref:Fucosyltransferase n=1 Tax=Holothuria leucospilota TaxID=206669 RepID=A0A9Q1HF61_HOLLE|nr:Alpha-(1,3)-fucosyltransferase 5 [Holothuria leucospilota]
MANRPCVFYAIVLVCIFVIASYLVFTLLWNPTKTTTKNTSYRRKDLSRRRGEPSSSVSNKNLENVLALDHHYHFNEVFRNPQPQEQFTVSPFDAFHGLPSLCKAISNHDANIVRTCYDSYNYNTKSHQSVAKSCCKIVLFVGMCGLWNNRIRKFPFKFICPVKGCKKSLKTKCGCTVVVDHVDTPEAIRNGDLVIFSHIPNYMSHSLWRDLLTHKHSGQRWVFSTIESPIYVRGLLPPWRLRNDTYEFADTFYSDADVSTPYGYYEPFKVGSSRASWNFSEHNRVKNKLISWTASHCETLQWDRINFVRDLQKILKVDTYGKCGNKPVCRDLWNENCSTEFDNLMKTYKFALSLENSCCHEYITEKFWKLLDLGTVPVVIGPPLQDLENQAPPGSFIHADQFESMKDLADYLLYLDRNTTAYMEFFSWKRKGRVFVDSIPEHYKRAVSDGTLCTLINLLLQDIEARNSSKGEPYSTRRVFDAYSSSWQGRCETCGRHDWLKKYEFPPEHKRKSKSLWV